MAASKFSKGVFEWLTNIFAIYDNSYKKLTTMWVASRSTRMPLAVLLAKASTPLETHETPSRVSRKRDDNLIATSSVVVFTKPPEVLLLKQATRKIVASIVFFRFISSRMYFFCCCLRNLNRSSNGRNFFFL